MQNTISGNSEHTPSQAEVARLMEQSIDLTFSALSGVLMLPAAAWLAASAGVLQGAIVVGRLLGEARSTAGAVLRAQSSVQGELARSFLGAQPIEVQARS
jgi:hypothetical protein